MTSASNEAWVPRAVLFDFDGTLADSHPLIVASLVHALASEGIEATPERVHGILGPPLPSLVRILAGEVSEAQYERIRVAYFKDFTPRLAQIKPLPGAGELLDALDARAIPYALVTNKVEASAAAQLDALGWRARFNIVVGSDSVRAAKPAAEPALLALKHLGVAPDDAAYVGDQEPDMECAQAAGIAVIVGLADARSAEALAASGATYVARSLDEVEAVPLRGDTVCA